MLGRVFIGIICLFLLIGAFASSITGGLHTWRTNNTSQTFNNVTTGALGTADVLLSRDLFQAKVSEIQLPISSNITETVAPTAYVEATKVLSLSMAPDQTRTLTIDYYAETDDQVMRVLGPFLAILIFGGCAGAILYGIFHKVRG